MERTKPLSFYFKDLARHHRDSRSRALLAIELGAGQSCEKYFNASPRHGDQHDPRGKEPCNDWRPTGQKISEKPSDKARRDGGPRTGAKPRPHGCIEPDRDYPDAKAPHVKPSNLGRSHFARLA